MKIQKYHFSRIKKIVTALFCAALCVSSLPSFSQSRSFAGLPILSPERPVGYEADLNDTPEFEHLLRIYDRLVEAKGDRRMPVPALHLRDEEAYVASMDYRLLDISLEKKAYDIAKKYGDGAIAFLLAHELVHYYEKHGWKSQFADDVNDLETGKVLKLLDERVLNEVQADVLGGFLAYSAGFGIFDKGGDLINDLYKDYKMQDAIAGYPSKKDRITLSDRNKTQVQNLANLFEMASYLVVSGRYSEAYTYYQYLLNKYQSRELYNNAGLTCMLAATTLFDPKVMIFDFPGMLDIEFSGDSRNASQKLEIDRLINESINHFETAILMNKNYVLPYVNKASANIINGINQSDEILKKISFDKARFILDVQMEELKNLNPELDYTPFDDEILILRSLLSYYEDNKPDAILWMREASHTGNETAKKNLAVLENVAPKPQSNEQKQKIDIGGTNAKEFLELGMVSRNRTRINEKNLFVYVEQRASEYKVMMHQYEGNEQEFGYDLAFLVNKDKLTKPFFGAITIGSDKDDLIALWGSPKRSFSHLNGEILLFHNGVIIITNSNNKIIKVSDYSVKTK
ncbi:MAG: hypothetical protein WAU01_09590 [Saprospiraceae bacterium]